MSVLIAVLLLILSNVFMTFAWYGHLGDDGGTKNSFIEFLGSLKDRPWFVAAIVSWGWRSSIRPSSARHRVASPYLSRLKLKMVQEVLSLAVFAVVAMVYWRERIRLDFLGRFVHPGAVFFVFGDLASILRRNRMPCWWFRRIPLPIRVDPSSCAPLYVRYVNEIPASQDADHES
ncbi:MAG: DMT family protein [Gemmataceae bacterium]